MERPIFQPAGTPVEELDTPALVVDLDLMERNIQTYHGYFAGTPVTVRPVITSHLCPQVARRPTGCSGFPGASPPRRWARRRSSPLPDSTTFSSIPRS